MHVAGAVLGGASMRLGTDWQSVRRGLFYGSAIGVGYTLAQYLDQWLRTGGFHSVSGY